MKHEKTCETCGQPFAGRADSRYCTRSCYPSRKTRTEASRRSYVRTACTWCGTECRREVARGHDPVCSPGCQNALMMFKSGRAQNAWPRTVKCRLCETRVEVLSGRKNVLCQACQPAAQAHEEPCRTCGKLVTSTYYAGAEPAHYCSATCRNRWKTLKHHDRLILPRFVSGTCLECGEHFTDVYLGTKSAMYCSRQCGVKAAKQRRRARKRDAFVSRVSRHKIYSRDRYVCHLCHEKTDPTKSVPHPNAPTIDHILPLAKGGTHEPGNVATACFRCNCRKGDRGGLEQLLLSG